MPLGAVSACAKGAFRHFSGFIALRGMMSTVCRDNDQYVRIHIVSEIRVIPSVWIATQVAGKTRSVCMLGFPAVSFLLFRV